MGVSLSYQEFDAYLEALSKDYRLFAPVLLPQKGKFAETDVVGYGPIRCFEDMVLDQKSYFSPKELWYPIRETLFYFKNREIETPIIDEKPLVVFLRPCDLNGVRRLDTIFLKNGVTPDFYYQRRRQAIKFIMIECTSGFDTCFCVSMGSNIARDYDGAVRFSEEGVLMTLEDSSLSRDSLDQSQKVDFEPAFIEANQVEVTIPPVDKVTKAVFEDQIWKEYTARCIACGRCNTSCITCSCFTMQDVKLSDDGQVGERRRVWAGCHVDGFTDMAGGHTFRKANGDRMRFKTMHKINDFYKRFDEHMCVGCGRCDDVCPEYISFSKCINKLNDIVKAGESHE